MPIISNQNSLRVLFDKIASVYFIWKIYLHFSIGNGQPRKTGCANSARFRFVLVVYREYPLWAKVIRQVAAAMRPFAVSTAETFYY